MAEYEYTVAEWNRVIESGMLEHYADGDIVKVTNKFTKKTDIYIIETKKIAVKTSKQWDE